MIKALVFPGMGANHLMYQGVWLEQEGFDYVDWPKNYIPRSIPDLAQYMSQNINVKYDVVIGSSLGGMVALEVATILKVNHVILIGSAVAAQEVNPLLRALTPLASFTPLSLCQKLAGKDQHLLSQMYADQNPEFIRAMIQAIPHWSFKGKPHIYRLHGEHDAVILCKTPDKSIPGGHLIAMTHSEECVESIRSYLSKLEL